MPEYLSPGVYVEEFDSGAVPMEAVSSSTAGFIGVAEKGIVKGKPQLVTSFADYQRMYGGYLSEAKYGDFRFLPYAVEQFFQNGGARAFVMRVAPEDAKVSQATVANMLTFTSANPGLWGDSIRVIISPASKAKTQVFEKQASNILKVKSSDGFNAGDVVEFMDGENLSYNTVKNSQDNIVTFENEVECDVVDANLRPSKYIRTSEVNVVVKYGEAMEEYSNLSFNDAAPNFVESRMQKSSLVKVSYASAGSAEGEEASAEQPEFGKSTLFDYLGGVDGRIVIGLDSGSDGNIRGMNAADYMGTDKGPGNRTGIHAFLENTVVSIMAVPGITDPDVQLALIAHCENLKSRFAVLDIPKDSTKVDELLEHRDIFDSTYAAIYHPWLESFDPLAKKSAHIPPSGAMIGIYARTDNERGVHKAPANEVVRACTGLSTSYNNAEQDLLNPNGVNLIRAFTGRGVRVWGARTLSSNALWKYINVRRLFIYTEETIRANTNWVVFEPNSEVLWSRVKRTIELFLSSLWRAGALAGTSPSEAYFVDIGPSTMTQDDIDNGRLICNIGIAPVKPAEFVIFRITQHTAEAGGE